MKILSMKRAYLNPKAQPDSTLLQAFFKSALKILEGRIIDGPKGGRLGQSPGASFLAFHRMVASCQKFAAALENVSF